MKSVKKLVIFLLVGMISLGTVGCNNETESVDTESASGETIILVDCVGREVILEGEAEKIVDLSSLLDGIRALIALNEQERLIGISTNSLGVFNADQTYDKTYIIAKQVAPELKALVNVGMAKEPNIEKIISLNPDVIFIDWMAKDIAEKLEEQTGIPVICVGGHGSFDFETLEIMSKVVGEEEKAEALITFAKEKLELISNISEQIPENERKTLFYWSHPRVGNAPKTNGNYEAFDRAGGTNLAKGEKILPKGLFEVTKEQVLAWNPDYIFMQNSFVEKTEGWCTIEDIKNDVVIQETKAVVNDNVYPIRGEFAGWDVATEITEVFYIAKILYPDLFADINVELEGNEILEKFYGKKGLYTDMSQSLDFYEEK